MSPKAEDPRSQQEHDQLHLEDLADRLTQVVDSLAGTITRTYDGRDTLLTETTPLGSVTYTYDLHPHSGPPETSPLGHAPPFSHALPIAVSLARVENHRPMGNDDRDLLDLEGNPELAIPGLVDEARKFFRDLLETNRSLRLRAASQDERLAQLAGEIAEARRWQLRVTELEQENGRLTRELASLTERKQEVELEHEDVSGRFAQIEEQYVMLANLYVASYQLHATLKYEDVLRVVKEILANLVGVKRMRLYLRTKRGDLLLVAGLETLGEGMARLEIVAEPDIARVMATGESHYHTHAGEPGPIAAVPLRIRKQIVGVLVIDQLLAHKPDLNATDGQLFDLLGGHVAVAIFRSRRALRGDEPLPSGVSTLADDQVDLNDLMLVT